MNLFQFEQLQQHIISNETTNLTIRNQSLFDSKFITGFVAVIALLISIITIVGNLLVITAFAIDKSLRTYSNYFILNLSIADLCIGILIPPYIPFLLSNYTWNFGRVACVVWLVCDYVVGSASVLCIVAISLDRYLLVSKGLDYLSKQRRIKTLLLMSSVWVIAFLNYGPAIIIWDILKNKSSSSECYVGFADNIGYLTVSACVEFFFPLISICSLNMAVYLNIRRRSRGLITKRSLDYSLHSANTTKIQKMADRIRQANNDNKTVILDDQGGNIPSQAVNFEVSDRLLESHGGPRLQRFSTSENCRDQIRLKDRSLSKDKKAARFLFIIVLTFGFCWAPYTFLALIKSVCKNCVNDYAFELSFWLLWFNSTINPIIYPFLHVKFRRAFLKIFSEIKSFLIPKCYHLE